KCPMGLTIALLTVHTELLSSDNRAGQRIHPRVCYAVVRSLPRMGESATFGCQTLNRHPSTKPMHTPGSITRLSRRFLAPYTDQPFVTRQKAYVLMWLLLALIPSMALLFTINFVRGEGTEHLGDMAIDLVFIASMGVSFRLLGRGQLDRAIRIQITVMTVIVLAGAVFHQADYIHNGFNHFTVHFFPLMIFCAGFARRRTFVAISLLLFSATLILYWTNLEAIPDGLRSYSMSGMLNSAIGIVIVLCLAYLNRMMLTRAFERAHRELDRNRIMSRELERLVAERTRELEASQKQVRILRGFLPICSHCKKIRDDNGYWNQIESYITAHSEAEFSHSICPECAEAHFGRYLDSESNAGGS
ncbi:MAG: hypothetical protein ACOWWM_05430, partial [Desulfobacterales bacterium]